MARPTPILWIGVWAQALPILAILLPGRYRVRASFWTALWCAVLLSLDGSMWLVSRLMGNNLWVAQAMMPITGALALWAVSHWTRGVQRTMLRFAIPGFVLAVLLLLVLIEDPNQFTLVTLPLENLIIMLAGIIALAQRALSAEREPVGVGTVLVLAGIILYAAATTAISPIANYLGAREEWELVVRMFQYRSVVAIVAFTSIALGIAWTRPSVPSGGFSSSRSSPPLYSSERSR